MEGAATDLSPPWCSTALTLRGLQSIGVSAEGKHPSTFNRALFRLRCPGRASTTEAITLANRLGMETGVH